jgi:ABC-type nickel/cobalt efflux system permease component RcnA
VSDTEHEPEHHHHESARHPVKAAEHEVEHLVDVAEAGEDEKTPAIVIGGIWIVAGVVVVIVLLLAWLAVHFFT